jgi:hypothetical protein
MMHKAIGEHTAVLLERKPVRVVICGEVNSGKSTVLNALLRERLIEDNLGRDQRPVVYANWRATPGRELRDADGRIVSEGDAEACELHLWSPQPHLRGIELIEVPLTQAEDLSDEQIALIGSADLMIWVTIASQAWRLTEKSLIEALGSARPENCILAISRADKLRSDNDRARLLMRVERESANWFDRCLFVSGARERLGQALASEEGFVQTGGAALLEAVREFRHVSTPKGEGVADCAVLDARAAARTAPVPPGSGGKVLRFPGGERAREPLPVTAEPVITCESVPEPEFEPEAACEPALEPEAAFEPEAPAQIRLPDDIARALRLSRKCREALAHEGLGEGVLAAGRIVPQMREIDPLHGAPEEILRAGHASADLVNALRTIYGERFGEQDLSGLNFTMKQGRLLARILPQGDLVFALCDPARVSEGAAMQVMGRLCEGAA